MLERVLDSCTEAAMYLRGLKNQTIRIDTTVLVPKGDPIAAEYGERVRVIEGPEHDVLERYRLAFDMYEPDFLVRITADCPYLPGYVISTHVRKSILTRPQLDYCSNTLAEIRTAPDGYDVEVMSARLMRYLFKNSTTPEDHEHVTYLVRRAMPIWAEVGAVIGYRDESDVKISVDTEEDYNRVCEDYRDVTRKIERAKALGFRVFRL